MPPQQPKSPDEQPGASPAVRSPEQWPKPQEVPVIRIVGQVGGPAARTTGDIAEAGVKYLLHCGWTARTYQVSARGLKVLRGLDIEIIDEPEHYSV